MTYRISRCISWDLPTRRIDCECCERYFSLETVRKASAAQTALPTGIFSTRLPIPSYLAFQVLSCNLPTNILKGVTPRYPLHAAYLFHHHHNDNHHHHHHQDNQIDQAFSKRLVPAPKLLVCPKQALFSSCRDNKSRFVQQPHPSNPAIILSLFSRGEAYLKPFEVLDPHSLSRYLWICDL